MAERIAEFQKVSFEQFVSAMRDKFGEMITTKPCEKLYDNIQLPKRATSGSAGYDFKSPVGFVLLPGQDITIPTGIRCLMDSNWVLMCYPRSGLGFKYQVRLANTCGIIDCDYYHSDNEGHIMLKIVNGGKKELEVKAGDGIAQGIFLQYGITYDDDVVEVRNGGFGSTGR